MTPAVEVVLPAAPLVVDLETGGVLWGLPSEELLEALEGGVAVRARLEQCGRSCAVWFPSDDDTDPLVFTAHEVRHA